MERMVIEKHGFLFVKDASKEYTSPCYGCDNINFCKPKKERVCGTYKALNKLKEYEDLEERKKILRLPCAVGDTVYTIYSDESGSFIEKPTVEEVSTHRIWIDSMYFDYDDIGKTVFLTQEQAEAALQQINEEER